MLLDSTISLPPPTKFGRFRVANYQILYSGPSGALGIRAFGRAPVVAYKPLKRKEL